MNLAWHCVKLVDGKPVLRDGRPMPPIGEWLMEKSSNICQYGLHGSWNALDALSYCRRMKDIAICLVDVDKIEQEHSDKFVCLYRKVLAWIPANDLLRNFARQAALSVLHLWKPEQVVIDFLNTGYPNLAADAADATYAAYAANAANAAYAAAYAAANAAAYAAAYAADAADADAAAYAADADAAAYAAAKYELNIMLESMLLAELGMDFDAV
jgi:hypothetical protein